MNLLKRISLQLIVLLFILVAALTGMSNFLCAGSLADESNSIQTAYGDVDRDGLINVFDLLAILRQISGKEPATEYSDLDSNGKTDIFDLLELLGLFARQREPLEIAATIAGHWLTEPIVYSYSQDWENNGVRDKYRIYSNHEIINAQFILDGDTLTDTSGTTPVLFKADADTVQLVKLEDFIVNTEPKTWKITVEDPFGNCVSDSGASQFVVVYPGIGDLHGGSNNVSEEIAFPLILQGKTQRFGIMMRHIMPDRSGTFMVDLNPSQSDSVVYSNIEQLAGKIMEDIAANDSLWPVLNIFGEGPTLFVSAAISREKSLICNRLMIGSDRNTGKPVVVTLDGNKGLISLLGFKEWMQDIQERTYNFNFALDPEVSARYGNWQ